MRVVVFIAHTAHGDRIHLSFSLRSLALLPLSLPSPIIPSGAQHNAFFTPALRQPLISVCGSPAPSRVMRIFPGNDLPFDCTKIFPHEVSPRAPIRELFEYSG